MGTRVAVMSRGTLEQVGTPAEVYARPASVFVAQFIGTPPMNILPAGLIEPGEMLVGVRPEHVQIASDSSVRASVAIVEQLGHETLVHCRVGETRVVIRQSAEDHAPAVGDDIGIVIPPSARHRFDPRTTRRIDDGHPGGGAQ